MKLTSNYLGRVLVGRPEFREEFKLAVSFTRTSVVLIRSGTDE